MNNRNQLFDVMRFFAALSVAFFHFNEPIAYINNPYRNLVKFGYLGVPVFFAISGFCIIFSAERSKNWKDFIVRRFFRIYPPYLVSLILTLSVVVILKITTGFNSVTTLPKNPQSIFCTLSLMTFPITRVPVINWVYWTLTLEIFYYVFTAIACMIPERWRLIFFVLISLVGWLIPSANTGLAPIFKYWPIFSLGICLYYIQKREQLVLVLFLMVLNLSMLSKLFLFGGGVPYFYVTIFTLCIIFLSFKYRMKKNWLSTAGDYSYSVYLLHIPVGVFLIGQLKTPYIQSHLAVNILFDIFCYLMVLFVSFLAFKWVELPSIALGKSVAQMIGDKKEIAVTQ